MLWSQFILCGTLAATVSIVFPGMLNMTVAAISIEKGFKAALRFSLGAGIMFIGYAALALFFADFLGKNPAIFYQIKIFALVLFLALTVVFYVKGKRAKVVASRNSKGNPFLSGMILTTMNAMLLPYFFAVGAYLETQGYMDQQRSAVLLFSLGAGVGAFFSFLVYAHCAQLLARRTEFLTKNINFIISGLFLILALLQIGNLLEWY